MDWILKLMMVLLVLFNIGCIYLVKMGELDMLLAMAVVDTVAAVQMIIMIRGEMINGNDRFCG